MLFLRGERDDLFRLWMSQQLHEAFRNSELLILRDARDEDIYRFMKEGVMNGIPTFFR